MSNKGFSRQVEESQLQILYNGKNVQGKARLSSLQLPKAGAIWAATPSWENRLTDEEFITATRMRLALPIYSDGQKCKACGEVLDIYGHHAAFCIRGGDRKRRHEGVKMALVDFANRGLLGPQLEPKHLLLDGSKTKPADIYLQRGGVMGSG